MGFFNRNQPQPQEIDEQLAERIAKKSAGLRYIDSWPGDSITDEEEEEMQEAGYEFMHIYGQGWQWVYVGGKRGRR